MAQTCPDYEHIIVDGASSDGTPAFLAEETDGMCRWISEPDGGIYEAMNKGVRMAQGDFCLFMNAGDRFAGSRVLSRIVPLLPGSDIVLGNEIRVDRQGRIEGFTPAKDAFSLENILQSSVSHQATFIRRELLLNHPYDESFRLVSDWKFILERYLAGMHAFKEVNVDVCFFEAGGVTDKNKTLGTEERHAVLSAYPQYASIWKSPFRPSLSRKAWHKTLVFIKWMQYAGSKSLSLTDGILP